MNPAPDLPARRARRFLSLAPEATLQLAQGLGERASAGLVVLLEGDLGAGKTCFARGFARGLGVTEVVASPTFALMNRYLGRLPLLHFDAWMEGRERALLADGGAELVGGEAVTLIEWGERVAQDLGGTPLCVSLAHVGGPEGLESRQITLRVSGPSAELELLLETLQPIPGLLEEISCE